MGGGSSKLSPDTLEDLRGSTAFSERELRQWYIDFRASCPDGRLDKKGMERMFKQIYPEGNAVRFAENAFRTYDKNGDGFIDFKEFMCGISVMSRGSNEDKLRWAFSLYDQDGNGSISREEAASIIQAVYKMYNTNYSTTELVDKMFTSFDKNKDGVLSMEEFIEGSKKDKSFIKILEWN
ncbi:neurocalcin-like [Lineus longissimus]|uniref:neurocalcin-like n=1 Tax=Lineus longissimus TaxID=88925 RepID=UPI002B4ECF45